jgi:hypothetical protein
LDWTREVTSTFQFPPTYSETRPRLSDNDLNLFNSKNLVETPEQAQEGLRLGTFAKGGYICLKDITYRICAPLDETTMQSCIFWRKSSSNDATPTWDKVVSSSFLIFYVTGKE